MKKKQVESASEEEELLSGDSEASDEEELQAEDSDEEELQAEDSEEENSDGSELELDASATESDEDDDEDEDAKPEPKSRAEIIDQKIHTKYEQLKGTRLYVRFPQKLPLDVDEFNAKVKALHPLVLKSTKPRQKHARFCLVDFKTKEDRDKAYEDIKTSIDKDKYKGIFVSLPKTDSDDFVNELVNRKQTSVENKRTKALMKRATKKVLSKGNFTSSVVITNLPKTSSVAQVRQLFPEAVDIQIRPGKGKFRDSSAATVTLPTTHDARKVIKQKLSLAGTPLILRFNTQKKRSAKDKLKRKAEKGKSPTKKTLKADDNEKSKAEKGESPKINKPEKSLQQKPKENLKRKTPKEKTTNIKTPKKLKKLSAE
ncbi:nucleolin [Drosophila subpulchrella]|uniref:nucleolin n=1 Tax=Drosophila subpulchrella TaxID=1486046 RepID=UPI0018A1701E|nr:nucleolin [Drosophila subpulchrella]